MLVGASSLLAWSYARDQASSADPVDAAKKAIEPAAPAAPAEVVTAMQTAQYEAASKALVERRKQAKNPDEEAYHAYLQAIAHRLGGQPASGAEVLRNALRANPTGRWAAKMRFELAGIELAAGNVAAAEELSQAEAASLLAGDRKDRLARVFERFARRLLQPDDPLLAPDPNGAYELFVQARALAEGAAFRAELRFAMGRASLHAANFARAIEDFQAYLKEYPDGSDRFAVRLQLGEVQRMAGQLLTARLTWSDLARDIERVKPTELPPDVSRIRAHALSEIPSTYGIPNPQDDTSLNLGVASLRHFLAAAPAHPRAVRAAYSLGASYLARGKSSEALDAFTRFLKGEGFRAETPEARADLAELTMTASFQVGQILQGQAKFAEAIAAWKAYLARFPNGPQSADSQRAILDTQLAIAADHGVSGRFAEARATWTEFVAQNPLDARVPETLFRIGDSFVTEKKFDQAVAAWEPLIGKFPGTEPAGRAQFSTASIYETEKGDLVRAIELFKKITVEPWHTQALARVAVMESKTLLVVTPRAFRSGETAFLEITSRNLESLNFAAYKLSAEAYFRKKSVLENVESLDIGLVAADASWTAPVPGYARYKPVAARYELKKLELPGVYVVKVTDEKTLQATTLVFGSDLDAIVKTSREQILVFAQDMISGKGRPGARVLVAEAGRVVLEGATGPDGVLLRSWEPPREANRRISYLVIDGPHVAGSALGVPERVAQGLSPRAYLYTDRPAYRPGQNVAIRGVVREVANGQYAHVPKSVYRLEIADNRGRLIVAHPVTLSEFGTFHETFPLDSDAPVGTYRVRAYQPGKSDFSGSFEVQSYQLEPIDLSFDIKKTVFYRGEIVTADVVARYQYGAPVQGRPLDVALPDGRILHGTTDQAGRYHVEFPTEGSAEEQSLALSARLPQDNVAADATVALAVRGFDINLSTTRDVYLDGESFQLQATTIDAQGQPVQQSLVATVLKQVQTGGRVTEREVVNKPLQTEAGTGRGSLSLHIDDSQGGRYVLRVAGTDRFKNPIVADRVVLISGKKDETKLRILTDRVRYKVGEEASVNLHSRDRSGTALLAWEADRILSYKIVTIKEGDNAIGWVVDGPQFPNFTLTATRMWRNLSDQARLDIQVERELRVTVAPARPVVAPGEPVELDVTSLDQLGRPVSAELSVALVDQSLLRLFHDSLPEIGPFFYNQTRTGAFATESTNTFRYEPRTGPVALAVVEEAERLAAVEANAADRARVVHEAQSQAVALGAAGNAPTPPAAAAVPPLAMRSEGRVTREQLRDGLERKESVLGEVPARNRRAGAQLKSIRGDLKGAAAAGEAGFFGMDASKAGRLQPRERFVETAYWNPSIITGKDGKARVTFQAPAALSEYRITARGVTGAETLAGQTTATLAVRKSFFVDLKVPSSLTQGDQPRFVARVHHTGVKGPLALRLAIYGGGRDEVYPRSLELKGDGVEEVIFEPYEVPDGPSVRLTLNGKIDAQTDELVVEVPVRPWGVEVHASQSGTSSESTTVFVGLQPGRTYESPEMAIVLSPTVRRMLIELAVAPDIRPLMRAGRSRLDIFPPPHTTADRAADLLAAAAALQYLRDVRATAAPEAERLVQRIRGLISGLIAAQNPDGGWAWTSGGPPPLHGQNQPPAPSDRLTSAAVCWSLAVAEPLGLVTDLKVLDQAVAYLQTEFSKLNSNDHETRAALLHALSTRRAASFEAANSLNRARTALSDSGLAYLALTFANLDRGPLAGEVLGILGPRAKTEKTDPGRPARVYWDNSGRSIAVRSPVEITALATLAYARARPQAPELERAAEWLLAHRAGAGWLPHKAKGPALSALGAYFGRAQASEDRYRLTVSVNETKLAEFDVTGTTEGRTLAVPLKALRSGQANRIRFGMEGRGRFGYAVALSAFTREFGPDQSRENRVAWVDRRAYFPAPPELDGKALPAGFSVAVNAQPFENLASQVALGGKAHVALTVWRNIPWNTPEWERDFLVVSEPLPAGTTLIEGSLSTSANSYSVGDGVLTLYFAPDRNPGTISYDVYGYLPGQFRTLPASVRSAYEPGRYHLGVPGALRVRLPAEAGTDPYKPTPDELYARGKAHFDAGRFAEAGAALEPLVSGYTLRDDVAKDAARMLLLVSIRANEPRKVVQYFEVVREKAPETVLTFEQLQAIGKAYRDINEYERAMIVWRGLIEASYLEDARVGELLRQRGKTLEAIAYLIDLWRGYPDTASIESDFFGLSQMVAQAATRAFSDPGLRRELAAAGITRSELLLQTIRMIQTFLVQSPKNPLADEASLALLGAFTELEDYRAVARLAPRFARYYPRSTYLDSFQYSEALANFNLGQYDRAIEVAQTIAKATYKDAAGALQPSPNKWQAIYILGQIHDARRQPARALEYYRQVADRFTDAASAIAAFTRKDLKVPEVSVIRPQLKSALAAAAPAAISPPRRIVLAAAAAPGNPKSKIESPKSPGIRLEYRNIGQVDAKVYPVDLMQLYLSRRNLNGIAGIDLAGITPLVEKTVTLGDGADYDDKNSSIDLPLTKEGAYLVMMRGENLYASGIVLVSPLEMEVLEEPPVAGPGGAGSTRVRVTLRDARTKELLPRVQVKVIGSDNAQFISGDTDLRGVFVAEGVQGVVTAVARKDSAQYAFYRGVSYLGVRQPVSPGAVEAQRAQPAPAQNQALDANLRQQNKDNSLRQLQRLEQRYAKPAGEAKQAPAGQFH
jgi:tetratricopeptide (TPR) repeat protein